MKRNLFQISCLQGIFSLGHSEQKRVCPSEGSSFLPRAGALDSDISFLWPLLLLCCLVERGDRHLHETALLANAGDTTVPRYFQSWSKPCGCSAKEILHRLN